MRKFEVYGDSWFEFEPLIESINKYAKLIEKKKVGIKDQLIFEYNGQQIHVELIGSYKNEIPNCMKEMFENFSHPDIVIVENGKIVLAVEDTETANVGNSQWQRMERVNFFFKKKIPFFYYTYSKGTDRSQNVVQTRYPSALQYALFKKMKSEFEDLFLIYREDQASSQKNHDKVAEFFLEKVIHGKQVQGDKTAKIFAETIVSGQTRWEKDIKVDIDNYYKDINACRWTTAAAKESKLISGLSKYTKSFNSGTQKVGWMKTNDFLKVLKNEFSIDIKISQEYVLLNPVMGFDKGAGKKILKVDPATGEFVAFSNLFKNDNVANIAIVFSQNATKNDILNSNCKLFRAVQELADLVLIANNKETKLIDLSGYKYSYNRKNEFSEDDVLKVVDDYMRSNGFERWYISPPSASWSKSSLSSMLFIEKDIKRPDYIYKKDKTIVIGEAKDIIQKLRKDRIKHRQTFNDFVKILSKDYANYQFEELNSAVGKLNDSDDFNYIEVNEDKGEVNEIYWKQN